MSKKYCAVLSAAAISTMLAGALSSSVSAKSTDILVQDKEGKNYQYNIEQVVESFIGDKALYNDLIEKGEIKAYLDDKAGYVDVNKIIDGFLKDSSKFELDTFTENASEDAIVPVKDDIQKMVIGEDGKPTPGEIIKPGHEDKAELAEAIAAAEEAIAALPSVEEVKIEDKATVANAKELVAAVKELDAEAVVKGEEIIAKLEAKIVELEEAAKKELGVESVSAINLNGVTLTLKALEEDMMEATVTVVDPNGKEVAVKAQDLSAGDTEVVFAFEKAYTDWKDMPAGIWTVNGTEYDFAAQLAVKAVKDAAAAGNQVKLLEALGSDYFKNVDADLIGEYAAEDFSGAVTVADVQEIIDDVNSANISASKVEAVNEAENQVELLTALQDGGWARVNADWIKGYYEDITAGVVTGTGGTYNFQNAVDADEVQAVIDTVNKATIDTASTGILQKAEAELKIESITNAESLIKAYIKDDKEGVTTKKDLLDRVAIHKAVIAVNEATTNNTLKSRLVSLAEVVNDASKFDIKTVNDVLLKEYRDGIADPTSVDNATAVAADKLTAAGIQKIIGDVNNAELAAAVADVETNFPTYTKSGTPAVYSAEDKAKALKELNRLADVSEDVDAKDIDEALITDYIDAINTDLADTTSGTIPTATTDAAKAAAIQALIEGANDNVLTTALAAVTSASDADALLEALKSKDLGLTNVIDANKAAYQADATIIKDARSETTDKGKLAALKKNVAVVNAVVDANKATTADAMRTALTSYAANLATPIADYINLSNQAKLEVAEIVLEGKKADFADSAELTAALGASKSAGALQTYDGILGAVNALDAGSDINTVDAALLKVKYDAYNDLDIVDRLAVAEVFLENLPVKEDGTPIALNYKSLADVKADIDAAIK